MRRLLVVLCLLSAVIAEAAGPRSWSDKGTATVTNSQKTVGGSSPFGPAAVCIKNSGSVDLYFDWTDGVAAATDGSTNLVVPAGDSLCFSNISKNVVNTMVIGFITGSSTADYTINAIAAN